MTPLLVFLTFAAVAHEPQAESEIIATTASPQALIRDAWRRIETGDAAGARLLTRQARSAPGADVAEAAYVDGIAWVMDEDPPNALAAFASIIEDHRNHDRALDAQFRTALVYDTLEDWDAALAALAPLASSEAVEGEAAAKVALCDAAWRLMKAPSRRAVRRVGRALTHSHVGEVPWFAARAERALVDTALREAAGLTFSSKPRQARKAMTHRAALLTSAERRVSRIIDLEQPEHVLAGLLAMGRGYEDLAAALQAAPEPPLSANQQRIYRDTLARRIANQRLKASRYYNLGLDHAGATQHRGAVVDTLKAALTAVMRRIEASP